MTLVPRAFDGEILPPGERVRVVGRAHALAGDRFDLQLPAGLSISELLDLAGAGSRAVSVRLDGHPIETRNFARIRLKPGVTLTVVPLAGNSNMRLVLSAVVAIAALVIAPYAAPAVATAFAAIGVTVSAATATAIAAAAIMTASTLAMNMLFPVRPQQSNNVTGATLNSIQGANNQANPFGAVPVVLGRHRQSPYHAAKPYTEISGPDQYLRLLFCLGYGPLAIEDLRIGETPLSAFSDYQVEIRQGFPGDAAVTLYPGSVDEVSLTIELDAPIAPYALTSPIAPGAWSSQTTAPETDQISLDFTAVQGIFATDKQGDEVAVTVYIEVQYRLAGSGASFVAAAPPYVIFTRSLDPARRGLVISVARGQYEVRARRASGRGVEQYTKDKITWTALRSIRNVAPIRFPKPLALVALRIRASDQLSGVINTFNCITTSLVKAYSGGGSVWNADTASQNPADLFRHVLQSPANARAVADSELDLVTLQEWWIYCRDNGFAFNQVVNASGSVQDKLADIAAAGRAVVNFRNGLRSVVWDRPADTIVDHFTPRNSWGLKGHRVIAQQPHGWRVTFINEQNGFTRDERIVYDDGYDAGNATLFEGLQFPGVTDPDLVWRHGRFHIAQVRLRPETISINVGWDQLVAGLGDRVELSHDVLLIGLGAGRVRAISGQVVTLDEILTIETGKTYGLTFRVADDERTVTRAVAAMPAGDYTQLTLVGDLSPVSVGDLFSFGETGQVTGTYRIKEVRQQRDLVATLTLVDDAPAIALADQGEIPGWQPNVTIPPDPFTLPPRDLRFHEAIDGQGATARALVHLFWQVPRFGHIAAFEVQLQDNDNGSPWVTGGSVVPPSVSIDLPITRAGVFSFRVRCIFNDGSASAWSTLENVSLAALSSPPADVTNLHQRSVDGQTVLDWTVVDDVRLINYELRKGTTWDTGLVVADVVAQPPWAPTGDGTYHIRAYVQSPFGVRVYSANAASIVLAGAVLSRNIVVAVDEQATGWRTGVGLDGGTLDGAFIRTDPSAAIVQPWAQAIVDQLGLAGVKIAIFIPGQYVDIGREAECRFGGEYDAVGVLQSADFLATTDFLAQTDVLGASPTRSIRAFPVWRFAGDGIADIFASADVFAEADVFAAGLAWSDWIAIASGARKARYYQAGLVLISDDATVNATATNFSWFVDVPDRTDDYTNLAVPDTGLALTFHAGGYDASPPPGIDPIPFNGGPNGAAAPHVQRAIINGTAGDEVKVTSITLAGCTVQVLNAGVAVARSGVNLLVRGY